MTIDREGVFLTALILGAVAIAPTAANSNAASGAEARRWSSEAGQGPECIKGGGGSLKLSLSGAHSFDLDWPNEDTVCHGSGTAYGVGVNFGRTIAERTTLTIGFTIKQLNEGETAEDLPVDVSVGGNAVDDNLFRSPAGACRVDILEHELLEDTPGVRTYRVSGRGGCEAPAAGLVGDGEITIGDFEFSGTTSWPK